MRPWLSGCRARRGVSYALLRRAVAISLAVLLCCDSGMASSDDGPLPAETAGTAAPAKLARDACVTSTCHGQWGEDAQIYHQPLREGQCTDCHIPDADYDPIEHDIFTFTFPDLKTQCLACHETVAKTLVGGTQVHEPADAGVCERCHDPHGNREDVFIISAKQGGEASGRGLWLSRGLNPQCVACHGVAPFGGEDASETGFRAGEQNLHWLHMREVEREIECVQCHEPHAGGQGKLLRSGLGGRWWVGMTFIKQERGGTCQTSCHLMPKTYRR